MTKKIWFASDHHFNHANILTFKGSDGKLIRPGFESIEHMNEILVARHNAVVGPHDKVYFGGDVGQRSAWLLRRMNGRKRLIMGNHDDLLTKDDLSCFDKVLSWRFFGHTRKKFVVSHYPLHPMSFIYRGNTRDEETVLVASGKKPSGNAFNVHGHIHEKTVFLNEAINLPDKRYLNICVEKLNYTPIEMEDLLDRLGK